MPVSRFLRIFCFTLFQSTDLLRGLTNITYRADDFCVPSSIGTELRFNPQASCEARPVLLTGQTTYRADDLLVPPSIDTSLRVDR